MPAPPGNQFWKQRSKHGRDKIFSSPDMLWEEACKYFQWCDDNPLITVEQTRGRRSTKITEVGEEGIDVVDTGLVDMPLMRAYTWQGLELFLGIESLKWYKTSKSHKDFLPIITHIGKIMYNQKFTGAAAGLLNPNIIARELGLTDKKEITKHKTFKFGFKNDKE